MMLAGKVTVACVILGVWTSVEVGVAHGQKSGSGLATPARKKELKDSLKELVTKKFEGEPLRAFRYYDADRDGKLDSSELKQLLADAGVGNLLTRGLWVSGVIKEADADNDGMISVSEFQAAVKR